MSSRLVEFQGEWYWWMPNVSDPMSGTLAPLEHCDVKGALLDEMSLFDSYAEVFSGRIMRHRQNIGTLADLQFLDS